MVCGRLPQVQRADCPLHEILPKLLEERSLSGAALARRVGVSPSHLSRALRQADYKRFSPALAHRIARALDLPDDFFSETREGAVVAKVRGDPELRDRLHDELFPGERRAGDYGGLL